MLFFLSFSSGYFSCLTSFVTKLCNVESSSLVRPIEVGRRRFEVWPLIVVVVVADHYDEKLEEEVEALAQGLLSVEVN